MYETDAQLQAALCQVSKTVGQVVAASKQLVKSLDKFSAVDALNRQDYVADAVNAFKSMDLSYFGGESNFSELIRRLEERLHSLRAHARQDLLSGLSACVAKPEQMRMVSDNPLVVYVHPLTLEVQFEQCKATWAYAREPMAQTSLDPQEIWKMHESLVDQFRAQRIDSRSFWKVLKMAYDMVVIKNGLSVGDRIDIVELLTPMAWIWPNASALKKQVQLPRYLLAYQIQKLRQEGLISHQGYRLDLGTATGGSTRNKANVLFIPMGPTEGQYYLSLCFRRE